MAAQDRIRLTGLLREGPPATEALSIGRVPLRPAIRIPRSDRRARTGLAAGRPECEHVFVLIVCVLIPRFELAVAAGSREALAAGPVALAPGAGPRAADRRGLGRRRGLRRSRPACGWGRRSRAARRCAWCRPTPPGWPTSGTACWRRWRGSARRSRTAVPASPGSTPRGLRNLYGGTVEGVIAAARRALNTSARLGAAPSRFAALAAASKARVRRPEIAPDGPGRLSRLPGAAAGRPARHAAGDPVAARRRSSASGSARSASSRSCRAPRWPTASAPPARPRATSRAAGQPAAPPSSVRAAGGAARAARVGVRAPARARARPADRPAARPPRAPRPLPAQRRAGGQAGGRGDVARSA